MLMKQILQSLSDGTTQLTEVPCPQIKPGHLLIRTHTSLVSAGTERMLVEFGKANPIDKARQQPEKVKQVIDKIGTDGLLPTLEAVQSKLDRELPMGYANAGIVLEVGTGVEGFKIGDRVVSNGYHAEVVCVPKNLCAKIPDGVSDESAAFTVISAISLQGIRLAQPTLGETFVVTGLGLIGLLTVQLLLAQGCRVIGADFDRQKLDLAKQFGADIVDLSKGEDPISISTAITEGRGVDGVIITASTKSNEPMHQAAQMCRQRGRIILVGVVGLELNRTDFYEKELTFQVSCSYGPGRYDPTYEQKGQDYPLGFVRWTEQRNFEAILATMAAKKIDADALISHRFKLDKATEAYELLDSKQPYLGILLEYPQTNTDEDLRVTTLNFKTQTATTAVKQCSIGFIGAGNYASRVLIPAFQSTSAILKNIATDGGVSGVYAAKKFGFEQTTTDTDSLIQDPDINTIVIATRHNSHAEFVCKALNAGKHVFVEKPLAISPSQLLAIQSSYQSAIDTGFSPVLMVGFNRRFAPQIVKIKELLANGKEPKSMIMTVNAGDIPADNWTQDPHVGGGRVIGEACHFIDLLRFITDAPIVSVQTTAMGENSAVAIRDDKVSFTLSFADGSFGTVHYLANGHKSFPKERLEIFCGGKILQLDNFRKLQGYGFANFKNLNLWNQDKGNNACAAAFVKAVETKDGQLIPWAELLEVAQTSITVAEAAR
jgi:predicted dehydrogenase/threonine dehydrogenase-like Zn-dependent dehydrogenase